MADEFTAQISAGRLFGIYRVVESSHRGMPEWGYCLIASSLYVGRKLFDALRPNG